MPSAVSQSRPEDPWAYLAMGRAQRANKDDAKAADAYRKAFETAKDAPVAADGTGRVPRCRPGIRATRRRPKRPSATWCRRHAAGGPFDWLASWNSAGSATEALAVAQSGVASHPKDPTCAHRPGQPPGGGRRRMRRRKPPSKRPFSLAPDSPAPARALLEFYAGTGRAKLARDAMEQMLRKAKLPEVDRELFRADGLVRIGDRKDAKDAYRKAVEAAKERSGRADAAG